MKFEKRSGYGITLTKGERSIEHKLRDPHYILINDILPCPNWYMKDEIEEYRYPFQRDTLSDRDQHVVYNPKKERLTSTYFNYIKVEEEYLKKDTENHFRIKKVLSKYSPTKEEIELVAKYLNNLIPEAPILITNRRKWVELVKNHSSYSKEIDLKDYRRAMMFFDLFSPELGLRIEIDSPYHDNDVQKVIDDVGEDYLGDMYGIKTIRYRSFSRSLKIEKYYDNNMNNMLKDVDNIVVEIYNRMKELSGLPKGTYSKGKLNLSSDILETIFGLDILRNKFWYYFQRLYNTYHQIDYKNGDVCDIFMDYIIRVLQNYYGFNIKTEFNISEDSDTKTLRFLINEKDW